MASPFTSAPATPVKTATPTYIQSGDVLARPLTLGGVVDGAVANHTTQLHAVHSDLCNKLDALQTALQTSIERLTSEVNALKPDTSMSR